MKFRFDELGTTLPLVVEAFGDERFWYGSYAAARAMRDKMPDLTEKQAKLLTDVTESYKRKYEVAAATLEGVRRAYGD